MATVISATTKFLEHNARNAGKQSLFLNKARILLEQAQTILNAGDADSALELSYQAALRTAGARIASSAVAKRKRKPHGAWAQLALVDELGKEQATEFGAFSRLRSRVGSGLEVGVDNRIVSAFIQQVRAFLDSVEKEVGWLSEAA